MTPAEKLSKTVPWRRGPRNSVPLKKAAWVCLARKARESLRLSLEVTAKAVGLSKVGLWQIEHGGDPQLTSARRIATFFGKTVEELWPERAI
jgi:DNA-binding XRE family transcriptional regulator